MARPKLNHEVETITFRISKEIKERLIAAALNAAQEEKPSALNLSDHLREIITEWVEQYELGSVGQEKLAQNLREKRRDEVRSLMDSLEA